MPEGQMNSPIAMTRSEMLEDELGVFTSRCVRDDLCARVLCTATNVELLARTDVLDAVSSQ